MFIFALKEARNEFGIRALCCDLKLGLPVTNGSRRVWVPNGMRNVRLTALFHSVLIWCAGLLTKSQVWHPYHEQQYVCRSLLFMLLDTDPNLSFSLLTWEINVHLFNLMSSESLRSLVTILPRCLICFFQTMGAPCRVTTRRGAISEPPTHMHIVFLTLNKTLNSSENSSHICNRL